MARAAASGAPLASLVAGLDPRPWRPRRAALILVALTLLHFAIYSAILTRGGAGEWTPAFGVVVLLAGVWYGARVGALFSLLAFPIHVLGAELTGVSTGFLLTTSGLTGHAFLTVIGAVAGYMSDMAQRVRAERDRSRGLLNAANDIMVIADARGRIVHANEEAAALVGVSVADLIGVDWVERFVPREQAPAARSLLKAFEAGSLPFTHENDVIGGDGKLHRILWRLAPWVDDDGEPRVAAFGVDITARREHEQQLLFQATVLENIAEPVMATNEDGRIVYWNLGAERTFGWPAEDVLGLQAQTFLARSEMQEANAQLERGRAWNGEIVVKDKHGETHVIVVHARAATIDDKRVTVWVAEDVTVERKTRAALAESEDRYRTIVETTPVGLYRTTPDGRILMANPALVRMLRYESEADLLSLNVEQDALATYDRAEFRARVEAAGAVRGLESEWPRADGTRIYVRENARAVRDADGRVVCYEGSVEDISDRRRMEQALRDQVHLNESLMSAQASMGIGLLVMQRSRPTLVNEAFCDMLGYERGEIMRIEDARQLLAPDSKSAFMAMTLGTGEVRHAEVTALHKSGRLVRMEASATRIATAGGERIVAIARDVTERYAAEQALRVSEERFRLVAQATSDVVWDWDVPRDRMWWSDSVTKVLGYSREEMGTTTNWEERVHPEDRASVVAGWSDTLTGRKPSFASEYRYRHRDGHYVHILDRGYVVHGDDGRVLRVIGAMMDITERKRADEEIRAASAYSRSLFEASLDPVVTLDAEGRIMDVNHAMERLAGVERDLLAGSPFSMWFKDPPFARDAVRQVLARGSLTDCLLAVATPDGREAHVLLNATVLRDRDGAFKAILATARDVTDRLRMEEQAIQHREAMHRNERLSALGTLVAGVAHEINNPLTYLQGNIELALMDLDDVAQVLQDAGRLDGPDLDATRRGLRSALGGAERISQITKALKAVARQRSAYERDDVDITGVLHNVESLVRVGVPERVKLEFEMPKEPLLIRANASEIHQVLLNLASNALDAVRERGGTVRIGAARMRDGVELWVNDDGIGMPQDVQSKLFTPFFTTKVTGTGLGLSIVQTIVSEHGGRILVESAPGEGSTFHVILPPDGLPAAVVAPPPAGQVAK